MVLSCGRDRPVSLFFFLDRTSATTSSVCSLRVVMMAADRHTGALSLFIKMRARSLIHTHTHTQGHHEKCGYKIKNKTKHTKKKKSQQVSSSSSSGLVVVVPWLLLLYYD